MATVLARPTTAACAPHADRIASTSSPPPLPHLSLNTSQRGTPAPIPNKHIPFCSPGPRPAPTSQLDTPPTSPPTPTPAETAPSLLYPPTPYTLLTSDPPLYALSAANLSAALAHTAAQTLPAPAQVFPWLHGLHADNHLQLAFFLARKKAQRRTPKCVRGITLVKAGGDLSHSRLKGAVGDAEIMLQAEKGGEEGGEFLDVDPREGFSVRNFQIQTGKLAAVSDVVVYGDARTGREEVFRVARRVARAQAAWLRRGEGGGAGRVFSTFVLQDDYAIVETDYPDLVALDSEGCMTNKVVDFFHWERLEMCTMSAASEIAPNVWLGPTPDPNLWAGMDGACGPANLPHFDILIEASDIAQIPDAKAFKFLEAALEKRTESSWEESLVHQLEFPGSGAILPPTWSQAEVDGLLETCQWIHKQATHGLEQQQRKRRDSKFSPSLDHDADGDSVMSSANAAEPAGRKVLIHCTDGYTETSLLALAYYIYANGVPVHDAWLQLHRDKGRNFFAYASDVHLLRAIQPRLLQASPRHGGEVRELCPPAPEWLERMDGSLPSRVLPYMYLGNLGHANNPDLLRELGIGQILSVGEPVAWSPAGAGRWAEEELLYIDGVQDNGVDPLTEDFARCLDFIEAGRKNGTATLVHCRVGVSRSATICIAEVMRALDLSFPRAYCFVRARRLNVIIQPHLRFTYELLKWEEQQCRQRGRPVRRELEWASICREIAAMNKPYARSN